MIHAREHASHQRLPQAALSRASPLCDGWQRSKGFQRALNDDALSQAPNAEHLDNDVTLHSQLAMAGINLLNDIHPLTLHLQGNELQQKRQSLPVSVDAL